MNDDFSALEEATMRIDELEYELSDAELKIQRVRELHEKRHLNDNDFICIYDDDIYPCATIEALDGENNG